MAISMFKYKYRSELQGIPSKLISKQEQTIITNHLEIRLTSRSNSNIWRSQTLSNDRLISTFPASWSRQIRLPSPRKERKRCSRNKNKHHPSSITDECQRTKKLCKPRMGGTRSKLDFLIGYYLNIYYPYKILNANQSYSIKLRTHLFVSAEITCNFSTREI